MPAAARGAVPSICRRPRQFTVAGAIALGNARGSIAVKSRRPPQTPLLEFGWRMALIVVICVVRRPSRREGVRVHSAASGW